MIKKAIYCLLITFSLMAGGFFYLFNRWKHLWTIEPIRTPYSIHYEKDDTLRIVMIGDSWADLHSWRKMDSFLRAKLEEKLNRPVSVKSKGKGGEKSRGIYQLMFETEGEGTKRLLLTGADYCIISAGINDAGANLGTKQFCAHYRMILDFLLTNNIRPIIIEVPDVDIMGIYCNKYKKDLLVDYLRCAMTNCHMYNYHEYRDALYKMLQGNQLMNQIIFIPLKEWNGDCVEINHSLFMSDKIHLNQEGYERLDTSIATAIVRDLQSLQDSTLVNKPVDNYTK